MNNDDLKHRLQFRVPPPAEGAKERAWQRAEMAFLNGSREPEATNAPRSWRVLAVAMVTCAAIAGAFFIGRRSADPALGEDIRLLAELRSLFPGQLQAIIRSGDQTEIVTSTDATTFSHQPLLVELRERGQRIRIVSFSGQRITAELDGDQITLEFLVTPAGAVIVTGDRFVWRSDQPHALGGLEINARQLTASL